jgi:uncharacterized membrane protein YhaH (DUF805 family)
MKYYVLGLKKYFNITERTTRIEFWYFFLFSLILSFAIGLVIDMPASFIFWIVLYIPFFTIQCRRLNDTGKRRIWAAFPLVLAVIDAIIYFLLLDNHSMLKNWLLIILSLMQGFVIVLLFIWYLKDSKEVDA